MAGRDRNGRSLALVALVALVGCDLPTDAPRWETEWEVPGETVRLGVGELLPSGIDVNADSSAFLVHTPEASLVVSLATVCEPCVAGMDLSTPVPKPEFEDSVMVSTPLPTGLVSAVLAGGALDVVLEHSFDFDPLNPSPSTPGAPRGHAVVRVTSGGATIARDSIDGADTAFGPGVPLRPDLAVLAGTVSGDLQLTVRIYSPDGDPVLLDSSDTLGVRLEPSEIAVSEVTIAATSIGVGPVATDFDFSGLDATTVERVQRGALVLDVDNPLDIEGSFLVAFQPASGPDVTATIEVQPGPFREVVEFTGEELRSILGSDTARLWTSGSVSAPSGTVTFTPDQVLTIDTAFRLVVLVGGTEEG
jgi:hypothetical protein